MSGRSKKSRRRVDIKAILADPKLKKELLDQVCEFLRWIGTL